MTSSLPPLDVLKHVVDVHCHPTDSEIPSDVMNDLPITICAMATRRDDQVLVAQLARAHPHKVIPCFGFHPWIAHGISLSPGQPPPKADHYRSLFLRTGNGSDDVSPEHVKALDEMLDSLPEPLPLAECLSTLRENFISFPRAMLGEVGLDRAARVMLDFHSDNHRLSPFSTPLEHQLALVEAQLEIAIEMQRNISFHSVKCAGVTISLLDRMKSKYGKSWTKISLNLHSCGLHPHAWRQIERSHRNVFLSLSIAINGSSPNHRELIAAASPDRLLVESDFHEIGRCTELTWQMVLTVAEMKGWKVEERWSDELEESQWGVVHRLKRNFEVFMLGGHPPDRTKKSKRKQLCYEFTTSESE